RSLNLMFSNGLSGPRFRNPDTARRLQMQGMEMVVPMSSGCAFPVEAKSFRRRLPRLLQLLVVALLMAGRPVSAKEHPVPLEKSVDSAKCLECHEDKTKGKAVHSAIATGCLSCHEVRVNKDITRV